MSVHLFSDVMSVYYGRKYFGEEAKTDVTDMIDKIKMSIVAVFNRMIG